MPARRITCAVLVVSGWVAMTSAGDWPQFRGPGSSATVLDEAEVPTEWTKDKNIKWKAAVPGVGWSSPVVVGNRVFITTAITEKQEKPKAFDFSGFGGKKDGNSPKDGASPKSSFPKGGFGNAKAPDAIYRFDILCLDRDSGKVLWQKTAAERKPAIAKFQSNSYASETPVTDGERLYAYFGMHGLFCYDLDGKQLWMKDLGTYKMAMGFGTGSSPALAEGRLFVQCDNDEKSFIAAFDAKSGKDLWRIDRSCKSGWSTPFVWKTKRGVEIVACGEKKVTSYDPASGKVIWELTGLTGTFQASPAADAERIYFGNSGPMTGGQLFAVKADASGDLTFKEKETSSEGIAWVRPRGGPGIASPLVYQGLVYILERGSISCYKAESGEPAYSRERMEGARGFTASPWAADGKIFCLDDAGQTFVLKAGPQFEILGKNKIDEMCWASPGFAAGMMFLRTAENLYGVKK